MIIRIISLFVLLGNIILLSAQIDSINIKSISINGNQSTKDYIILREITFLTNRNYSAENLVFEFEKSKQNLINTSLFHNANIFLNDSILDSCIVEISVVERWYIWPIPNADIDERNFNVWWQNRSLDRLSAGVFLTKENFRGRMETVSLLFMAGYNQQFGVLYDLPYLNKAKTFGMGGEVIWTGRHEVIAFTLNDKQVFFKEWKNYARTEFQANINFQIRKGFYVSHFFQLGLRKFTFSDSVLNFAPNYSWNQMQNLSFLNFYYKLKVDFRDFKPYPLNGYYVDIELFKHGLGLIKSNQNINLIDFKSTLRKYWSLSNRNFLAFSLIGKLSNYQGLPYFLQKSLGFNRDFIRGYEYYIIDGQHYLVGKSNYKFALMSKKYFNLNLIKSEKFNKIPLAFYANLFVDAGLTSRNSNELISNVLPGQFLYSAGLGIDLVTYYDKVARFEYSVNKFGERAFYLHFIAPI